MRRLGIKGYVRKQLHHNSPGTEHDKFPNVLNRKFHSDKPMQKIVTDVTYIQNKGKWYSFACYLDLFNNEILDWGLSEKFDNYLVMKPAKESLKKQRAVAPKSFSTATRVSNTHQQVIVTCLNHTT